MENTWTIDDITKQSLLYDFYGQLLTKRQQQVMELYHGENLSLAEIAEEFGISRQGVHDALRSARKALEVYEEKLGLMQRFLRTERAVREIDRQIQEMTNQLRQDEARRQPAESKLNTEDLILRLEKLRSVIDQVEE